jgi:N,N'-diacetylchitobiose phosphorylase
MQYGYFDDERKEYVITRPDTPRPWSNYLGSLEYGAIITNNAGGYSFYKSALSSRFLRFRSNSVPMDQPGRYLYLRDASDGDYWSTSWQPVGKSLDSYRSECRHGTSYTVIESAYRDIRSVSTYFVPLGQAFEYWMLEVTNEGTAPRELDAFTYCEFASPWHMPNDLTNLQYSQFISKADVIDGMLAVAVHPYDAFDPSELAGCHRLWMCLNGTELAGYETVRERFFGTVYTTYANPSAVVSGACSNFLAEGENAVGVLQGKISLSPGETKTLVVQLGLGTPESHGFAARAEFGTPKRCRSELEKLRSAWHARLAPVSAKTPVPSFDSMVNAWGAYNSLITYTWSRHASLVYNGERDGLGYRDTVQDFLGVLPHLGAEIRPRLELMLTGQMSTGGAMPVVKSFGHRPGFETGPSADEYRSDDCLWLFNAVPAYVAETGDESLYGEVLPYADRGEGTVLEHLKRALLFNLERSGANGLPCGLAADWNDCVKMGYRGESVMVAFQLRLALGVYADVATRRALAAEAKWALDERARLDADIRAVAWDGDWFLWAIGEDGHRYGSSAEEEGKIYINTQVWAIISGAASAEQGRRAMDELNARCATPYGIALSDPPFTRTPKTVMGGVIYNHGIKENAGIFCHTQSWAVMAEAMLGNGDRAWEYYEAFMPSAYNDRAELREIEPYAHCQTTYSTANRNAGKSRVPWLSGTASWAHYAALQWILGVRPELDALVVDPCIPRAWPRFHVARRFRGMNIDITVENPRHVCRGARSLTVDGTPVDGNRIPLSLLRDGAVVRAELA